MEALGENIVGQVDTSKPMTAAIADHFKSQPAIKAWRFGAFARGVETPNTKNI